MWLREEHRKVSGSGERKWLRTSGRAGSSRTSGWCSPWKVSLFVQVVRWEDGRCHWWAIVQCTQPWKPGKRFHPRGPRELMRGYHGWFGCRESSLLVLFGWDSSLDRLPDSSVHVYEFQREYAHVLELHMVSWVGGCVPQWLTCPDGRDICADGWAICLLCVDMSILMGNATKYTMLHPQTLHSVVLYHNFYHSLLL
jgi:hypothetical protein